jgi:cell division protein FtsQ
MKNSMAVKIKPYNESYIGNVLLRKRKIRYIKSALFLAIKLTFFFMVFSAIGLGGYKGYRYVVSSPYFNISDIAIEGNVNFKRDDLISLCGVRIGQNIFSVMTEDVYTRLTSNPWIKNATIKKEMPDRLHIKINERNPAALLMSQGIYLMSGDGVVLMEVSHDSDLHVFIETGLPVIVEQLSFQYKAGERVNSEEVFGGMDLWKRIREVKSIVEGKSLEAKISRIEPMNSYRYKLYLKDTGGYIVLDNEDIFKKVQYLQTIMNILKNRGDGSNQREFDYIDLSYRDKVIVKYKEIVRPNA